MIPSPNRIVPSHTSRPWRLFAKHPDGYVDGPPEFVIEIAHSSKSLDLHANAKTTPAAAFLNTWFISSLNSDWSGSISLPTANCKLIRTESIVSDNSPDFGSRARIDRQGFRQADSNFERGIGDGSASSVRCAVEQANRRVKIIRASPVRPPTHF